MRDLKQALATSQPLRGSYSFTRSPAVIEVLGRSGVDFVIIDMEHSAIDWEAVQHLVRAAHVVDMAALVRVRTAAEEHVYTALDAGADGIVLPFLRDAEQLRGIVHAVRYAPQGGRHYCSFSAAWGYGTLASGDNAAQARRFNDSVVLFGIVESAQTLDALDEILAVEGGLDAVSLGRGDYATSLNLAGQVNHPLVQAAAGRLRDAVGRAPRKVRISQAIRDATSAEEIRAARRDGVSVFVNVSDTAMLIKATREFAAHVGEAEGGLS